MYMAEMRTVTTLFVKLDSYCPEKHKNLLSLQVGQARSRLPLICYFTRSFLSFGVVHPLWKAENNAAGIVSRPRSLSSKLSLMWRTLILASDFMFRAHFLMP